MLPHKICKKYRANLVFALIFVFLCSGVLSAGKVSSAETPQQIETQADELFYQAVMSKDENLKEAYLAEALAKYMLLLNMQPDNVIFCTQIGVIHDISGRKSLARKYFYRAVSLENLNPFANFNFGEYYFNIKDYRNALKYYKISLENGYDSYYEVHNRLAIVYEKLGDLKKAQEHYSVSLAVNPEQKQLNDKIIMLGKVYYSKKDYKQQTSGSAR